MDNSIRDELKDRIRDILAEYHKIDILEVDAELVAAIADEVFLACGVFENKQDEPCLGAAASAKV